MKRFRKIGSLLLALTLLAGALSGCGSKKEQESAPA